MGDGRMDSERLMRVVQAHSRAHHVLDMGAMARESGTIVSAVMLGAVAGCGLFPFKRTDYEAVMGDGSGTAAASLRGFAKAFDRVAAPSEMLLKNELLVLHSIGLQPDLASKFPAPVHDMLALGHARMLEYQGAAYAQLYVDRLQKVLHAEQAADPSAAHQFATTPEMARWLALWMAFDDIVRVADLKSRASRWQRVAGEVKAGERRLAQGV